MLSVVTVSAAIGISISGMIFYLVRKDRMMTKDGLAWLLLALIILVLSLFPQLVDAIGRSLGIAYPPILLVLVAIGGILLKLVLNDVEKTQIRADLERLLQHNALLQAEVDALKVMEPNVSAKKETLSS